TTTTTRAVPRLSPSLNRLATTAKRYKKSRIVLGSCPEPADRSDIAIRGCHHWHHSPLEQEGKFLVAMKMKSYPWLKPGIWGAIVGAIAIMVLGFWQFGWVLGSKADQMARDRASTAVAEALARVRAPTIL